MIRKNKWVGALVLTGVMMAMVGGPGFHVGFARVDAPVPVKPPVESDSRPISVPVDEELDNSIQGPGLGMIDDSIFVDGADAINFDYSRYIKDKAPHLLPYIDTIVGYSQRVAVSPKVALTIMEMRGSLISDKKRVNALDDLMGYTDKGFTKQLEKLLGDLNEGFGAQYYAAEKPKASKTLTLKDKGKVTIPDNVAAGEYGLQWAMKDVLTQSEMDSFVNPADAKGFAKTYDRLFGGAAAATYSTQTVEAENLSEQKPVFQLPFKLKAAWYFGGVHHNAGTTGTDWSAIDFTPNSPMPAWGTDTSTMNVVAVAGGKVVEKSNCRVRIQHFDENETDSTKRKYTKWFTQYYHLQDVSVGVGDIVARNQSLGVLANSLSKATCNGGSSSAVHLHFALLKDSIFTGISGSAFSGWTIMRSVTPYDSPLNSKTYMYQGKTKAYAMGHQQKRAVRSTRTTCQFPNPISFDDNLWNNASNWPQSWNINQSCALASEFKANEDVKNTTIEDLKSDDYTVSVSILHDGKTDCTDCGNLDLDFTKYKLLIKNGTKVAIQQHAKIN